MAETQMTVQTQSSKTGTDAKPTTPIAKTTECGLVGDTKTAAKDRGEDEEGNDEDEEEETSDLQDALQEALDESNFEFQGSFYHESLMTSTPNPCLIISGLGLVGLPLNERDAKAIISFSTMAPFGQGERLVVDKEVRDTWEIEASSVAFGNPTWLDYVNKTLCAQICESLGVEVGFGTKRPRMELYKLLVYETGSHFLPHQDTQKADGMFATAIILLPSAYTGGEVIVSHASSSKTIDFAKDSAFSMASLAWYTDVKHEVKPVTSGYRLALSYNLIHVAPPGVPPPRFPDTTDNVDELRRILTKWRDNQYKSSPNFMAYMLEYEYSQANLSTGLNALKGSDLHRVSFLRPVAEGLGFKVGLALLEHNVRGQADMDYEDSRSHQRRSGPDVPEMDKSEIYRDTTLSGLVDLDGQAMLSIRRLRVESDCLIPKDPFEDEDPDEQEYEGYQGNYPGTVEHWYRSSAFFLVHETRIEDVFFANEGLPYAFKMLQRSTAIPPTAEDRRWAARMFKEKYRSLSQEHVLLLLNLSLRWRDLELWKMTTNQSGCSLSSLKTENSKLLFNGIEIFSFDAVRLSFETILARSTDLAERLDFLSQVPSKASVGEKNTVDAWYQRELSKILSAYRPSSIDDVPTALSIIRVCKLKTFVNIVMPNIIKEQRNYHFCMALTKSLSQNRQDITEQELPRTDKMTADSSTTRNSSSPDSTADAVDTLIKQCLQTAMSQWNDVGNYHYNYRYPSYATSGPTSFPKVDRIIEIIDLAMSVSDPEACRALFVNMLKSPGPSDESNLAKRFEEVYTPLIPRLRTFLATKNLQLFQPPFGDFIHSAIEVYLRDILGPKDQVSIIRLRKIGCGCGECETLDDFILSSKSSILIHIQESRRVHLEQRVAAARDLCTYQTSHVRIGGRRSYSLQLQVTKLPTVVEALQSRWSSRKEAAKNFLASIGSEAEIACIMGTRYDDVKAAIAGKRPFVSVPTILPALSTSGGLVVAPIAGPSTNVQPGLASSSSSRSTIIPVLPPSMNAVPGQLAGKKRKL